MPEKITHLRIYCSQTATSDTWTARFDADWSDGAHTAWDVNFPGKAEWVEAGLTDDVWIAAVLRTATDNHQPIGEMAHRPADWQPPVGAEVGSAIADEHQGDEQQQQSRAKVFNLLRAVAGTCDVSRGTDA